MNRQQRRKLNREHGKIIKNYKFTEKEYRAIYNCIRKIRHGLVSICSIQPCKQPIPIEYDNFICYRIGLALDIVYLIDCGNNQIISKIKISNSLQDFNGLLFPNIILMRNILRRVCDLTLLWKNPEYTEDYWEHQNNNERGEWAKERHGITYQDKTEQGIILVMQEIYGTILTNDDFKNRSNHFNDVFYGKNAIERYIPLVYDQHKNDEAIKKIKGNIIQYVIDCYEYVDLIIRGFQKYEKIKINNSTSLDINKDTASLNQIRKQYSA